MVQYFHQIYDWFDFLIEIISTDFHKHLEAQFFHICVLLLSMHHILSSLAKDVFANTY